MYPKSLKLTLQLYPFVLLVIVFHLVFGVFSDVILSKGDLAEYQILIDIGNLGRSLGRPVIFILETLLAFFVYVSILGISLKDTRSKAQRFAVFAIVALGLNILADLPWNIFSIFRYLIPVDPQSLSADNWAISIIANVGVFNFLFGALVYSLLGTLLAATVATGSFRPAAAYRRGKSIFWFVLVRLVVGPGVLVVLASLVQAGFYFGFFDQNGLALTGLLRRIAQLVDLTILYFFTSWAIVMTAWILSKAFLKAEEDTAPSTSTPTIN